MARTGYHFGSVWPLFTGWASVAGYRYHRADYGYENLMANAQLADTGSPGRTTEVLSGDFYTQLSTSTPHQIWSSAMVISPILRGMMGLDVNALNSTVTFAPHVPAGWTDFAIKNVKVGSTRLDFTYHAVGDDISLEIERHGTGNVDVVFAPAISLRAKVASVEVNGSKVSPKMSANENDQHATIAVPISADKTTIHLRVTGNFGIAYPTPVPADGAASSNLRIVSEQWNAAHDSVAVAGRGRQRQDLRAADLQRTQRHFSSGCNDYQARIRPCTRSRLSGWAFGRLCDEVGCPPVPVEVNSRRPHLRLLRRCERSRCGNRDGHALASVEGGL